MGLEISVLCKLEGPTPSPGWRAVYHPVFATALYLRRRLGLTVTPLFFGGEAIPSYLTTLPFQEIHLLDTSLPPSIDLYDLASILVKYTELHGAKILLTPADTGPFPLLSGAIAQAHNWPYATMVTSVEVFNQDIYVVRPTFGGNLTQIFLAPLVLSISSASLPLEESTGPALEPKEITTESVGKDKLLIMARAEMAPATTPLPERERCTLNTPAEALSWLFEE